jgi:hypothetical protein
LGAVVSDDAVGDAEVAHEAVDELDGRSCRGGVTPWIFALFLLLGFTEYFNLHLGFSVNSFGLTTWNYF